MCSEVQTENVSVGKKTVAVIWNVEVAASRSWFVLNMGRLCVHQHLISQENGVNCFAFCLALIDNYKIVLWVTLEKQRSTVLALKILSIRSFYCNLATKVPKWMEKKNKKVLFPERLCPLSSKHPKVLCCISGSLCFQKDCVHCHQNTLIKEHGKPEDWISPSEWACTLFNRAEDKAKNSYSFTLNNTGLVSLWRRAF